MILLLLCTAFALGILCGVTLAVTVAAAFAARMEEGE